MSKVGQVIHNPISGESFTFLKTAEETNGAYFQFEWRLKPDGLMPFAHVHPYQTETFEVLQGEMSVLINHAVQVVKAGETITVPAGAVHQPMNPKRQELLVRVTFRPALNADLALETICALAVMSDTYPDDDELAAPPIPAPNVLKFAAMLSHLASYRSYYPRYSE
ncbi:MAG: cupin domain-containing protein [Anaerolineae bacterium]|nr:cupin domain-containing protein [Anaerolineae bacterium]